MTTRAESECVAGRVARLLLAHPRFTTNSVRILARGESARRPAQLYEQRAPSTGEIPVVAECKVGAIRVGAIERIVEPCRERPARRDVPARTHVQQLVP